MAMQPHTIRLTDDDYAAITQHGARTLRDGITAMIRADQQQTNNTPQISDPGKLVDINVTINYYATRDDR